MSKKKSRKESDLFGRRSLHQIVGAVMTALGNQAAIRVVVDGVRHVASKDEWEWHAEKAMANAIRGELRRPSEDSGDLPEYLAVGGVYKALRLFEPVDYEEKARDYAKLGRANRDKVYALAEACREAHGTTFDANVICVEFGIGERAAA